MASREELLQSIRPGMKLDRAFFLKIYGYELTWPGFRETAINALESAGCSRAQEYYDSVVGEYEKGYQEKMEEVSKWYLQECDREWKKKEGEAKRRKQYSINSAQNSSLRRQREKLTELQEKFRQSN